MPPESHFHPKVMGQECTDVHFPSFESRNYAIKEIHYPSVIEDRKHIRE